METGNGELIYYKAPSISDAGNKNGRILGQIVSMVMHNSWTLGAVPPKTDMVPHKSRGGAKVGSQNINFCLMDALGDSGLLSY